MAITTDNKIFAHNFWEKSIYLHVKACNSCKKSLLKSYSPHINNLAMNFSPTITNI